METASINGDVGHFNPFSTQPLRSSDRDKRIKLAGNRLYVRCKPFDVFV